MKQFLFLLSISIAVYCQSQTVCPQGLSTSNDDCIEIYTDSKGTFDFSAAQQGCRNTGVSGDKLLTILDNTRNDLIVSQAKSLDTHETIFWLGLHCYKGKLFWAEDCAVVYVNFNASIDATTICSEKDNNVHFVIDTKDGTWKVAPEGFVSQTIFCSHSTHLSGCSEADPDNVRTMRITELIILSVSLLTVVVIVLVVCGCFAMITKRQIENEKKAEDDRLKKECAEYLQSQNINFNIEEGQFKFNTGKATALAAGGAVVGKAMERTPSMRYTAFPGAGGAGKDFDEWEIDRRHVSIDYTTKLGQGAFRSVYLGIIDNANIPTTTGKSIIEQSALKKDNNAVAIKMLHESADKLQQMQFFEEIDLMKRLGYHERLVNMLACATQSEPALLIIEYCSHGDLLNYMRERREIMLGAAEAISSMDRSKIITQKQQLMFCVQIAYGMEYLSQRGFVHRDIAARNILVDQHESCKIGDFGLCREVEKEDEHYHSRGGRLPLKWMSPEAIERYDFSIASDVWAFGVLLFEIITLGGNPYPDWPAAEILNRLKRGRRMDRPDNCTEHMFTVMNSCWKLLPADRPSFSELRMKMGIALEEVSEDDYYLKLNARAMYYCTQSDIDEANEIIDEEDGDESIRL